MRGRANAEVTGAIPVRWKLHKATKNRLEFKPGYASGLRVHVEKFHDGYHVSPEGEFGGGFGTTRATLAEVVTNLTTAMSYGDRNRQTVVVPAKFVTGALPTPPPPPQTAGPLPELPAVAPIARWKVSKQWSRAGHHTQYVPTWPSAMALTLYATAGNTPVPGELFRTQHVPAHYKLILQRTAYSSPEELRFRPESVGKVINELLATMHKLTPSFPPLTGDAVVAMLQRWPEGLGRAELATEFGVSLPALRKVLDGLAAQGRIKLMSRLVRAI